MEEAPLPHRPAEPASSPTPGAQYGGGFVEAHRQKIFLWLSVAGTLLLGPFAINNFFQDRVLVGVATIAFVFCLLANAQAIARGRQLVVSPAIIFFASLVGLSAAMYNNGLIGILWVYPGVLLYHFVLPRRTANFYNVTLVLLAIPMTYLHLGPNITVRVAVTLVLLVIFSNIFSYIADVQQAKEAEQRQRLDVLVQQLEEQNNTLREAFRLREEVERIARHDLKTPLASIASVPRLLRERRQLDSREEELVGMVERAARRVLSMVNLSLDLYRMEEGNYRLRPQAVDLGSIVETVSRELQGHVESKQLRLVLDLPAEPAYAQGEELLCYSTVANLLKNALEASPDGGDVRASLRVAEQGDAVELAIHNAGEVPEVVRARFFSKYATYGKRGGTGLGAYSARLMARVQHGELQMESAAGRTALTLRLPRSHAVAPSRDATGAFRMQELKPAQPLPALSVLAVDDDEYNIIVLKSLLPSPPLTVRTAVNGRAALQCVTESRPDVIFMDVEMPVMGGIEAVNEIRALQRERGERPSFITAFSAHEDEVTRQRCLDAGFDLYLSKPASREEVDAVLHGRNPGVVQWCNIWVEPSLMHLMPEFLASRRGLAQDLVVAAQAGERETVRVTAHKLAGSLAMFGFGAASRASLDVENAAPGAELPELSGKCEALVQLLAQTQAAPRA